jgi:NAD+ kinase
VLPEAKVLIISPIAPHNLNVRPMVVPDTAEIHLRMTSRDGEFVFSSDNRSVILNSGIELDISVAQFSLRRVRLNRSNFINALTQKLFWGEDVRNLK